METTKASIEKLGEKYFIKIKIATDEINIPMSEDKPKEVKSAFNKIIARMKDGAFQIVLEDAGEDLFSQVAKEYVTQLNREIQEVYGEMQRHGLVNE